MPWGLVIIHYRDQREVRRLVAATQGWVVRPSMIVVVDNSDDLGEIDGVVVVSAGRNLGYAGAANLGLSRMSDECPDMRRALLCTQDAVLDSDAAAGLLATMDRHPACAVAAPLLAYASRPDVLFSSGGLLSGRGYGQHPGQGSPRALTPGGEVEVDWVDGAITMLDIAAVRSVGGFDSDYFLYVEEIDLQTRLRLAGRSVMMNRDVVGYQEPGRLPDYLKYRNGVYFTHKLRRSLRTWPVVAQFARDSVRHVVRRAEFSPVWAIRGALDGHRGRMGVPCAGALAGGRRHAH